jgi:membrane protein DedA with SNARE-associated domain
MHSLDFLSNLIGQYGVYAVFVLAMIEGDITLLLAGVLAHSHFFNEYSFAKVLLWGTLGGVVSDNVAYFAGRVCGKTVRDLRFYRAAQPRIERLTDTFGGLAIFLSKYIYGLRWASSIFYGVARMPYVRFFLLSLGSCFVWVFLLSGAGYFFSGAVIGIIGDFQRLGKILLVIVVVGIIAFYLAERFWLSKKVEDVNPDLIQDFEQAAQEKVQELRGRIPFGSQHARRKESDRRFGSKPNDADGK